MISTIKIIKQSHFLKKLSLSLNKILNPHNELYKKQIPLNVKNDIDKYFVHSIMDKIIALSQVICESTNITSVIKGIINNNA